MADFLELNDRLRPDMRAETRPGSRRRRSFLAATAGSAQAPVESPPIEPEVDDDDLPLLTEVVEVVEADASAAAPAALPADRLDEALLSVVTADLVHTLEQQLVSELPALVESALYNAQNELRASISATLNLALRDFLAQRQQLRLPLEDPGPNE